MRLKELREEAGLSQIALAKATNTSQRNISRWENGENEPTMSFLIELAKFFNVSIDYLTGYTDDFGNIPMSTQKKAPQDKPAELLKDEQELLAYYEQLNPDQKEFIFNLFKTYFPEEKEQIQSILDLIKKTS